MRKIKMTDLAIILALTILFVIIIVTNSRVIIRSMMNQTEQIGQSEISNIKTDFENYITNAENSLVKVSSGAEQLMHESDDKKVLEEYIISQKNTQLDVSNGVNFNVYIAGQGWEIIPDFDAPDDYHATERNWYIGAVDNKGEIFITDPYIDQMTGEMCFTLSVLLSDGETVVAMDFTLSEIQESIEKMSLSDGSVAMIVTAEGLIVGYSDMSYVGKDLKKALSSYGDAFDHVLDNGSGESFETKIDGRRNTVFYSMTKNNWYMILSVNNSELYRSAIRQVTVTILVNIVMLILIIILYIFTVRNRIKSEEAQAGRELFVEGIVQKLREPLDNINSISNKGYMESSDTKEDYASIKTSVLRITDLMNDLNSYNSIVSNMEEKRNRQRKASKDLSKTIRISRNVIVILLLIVLSGSTWFYYMTGKGLSNNLLTSNLNYNFYQFEEWKQEQMTVLNMFTDTISADPELMADYDKAIEWLDSVAKNYPSISVCYLANPYNEKTIIMNNGWEPEPGWKVEERPWYISTEKSNEGYSISAPYYDAQTGDYCITISKIVYGKNKEFLGIFGIDLYMDKIVSIFGNSYNNNSYVFLVDSNGDIINHPNDKYQMSDSVKVNITDTPYVEAYYDKESKVCIFKDYDGVKKCGQRITDESTGFSVIMVCDWLYVYLYQMAFAIVHGIFVLAIIVVVIILLNKVIQSQAEMNRKLSKAVNVAEEAGKAKSNFLAQMSHEIRTPINAVIGMDEMILRECTDSNIREYATDIKSASRTLLSLINGILDFSKIESGKMEIIPVNYNTAEMIDSLVNMISDRVEKKDLSLVLDIDENLPQVLYGDDVRIRQVITNLLTNAVKYTEKGSITLSVQTEEITDKECTVFVEVKDTGIGIKQEDMERLFLSFERIEESRNRNIEGTGLGMSIVEGILKLMGSSLNVSSEYGKGSSFSFSITQSIIDATPMGEYQRHHEVEYENVKKKNLRILKADILVVDDNDMNLKVARGLMKKLEIIPDLAGSGHQAIEMLRSKHYDVVFMDHLMPDMDGIETLKQIRKDRLTDDTTVIIALTANAIAGAKDMYISNGFNDYMTKPIDPDMLEKKLTEYLPKDSYCFEDESETGAEKSVEEKIEQTEQAEQTKEVSPELELLRDKGFNIDAALDYAMNDSEFYKDLLKTYIQQYPEKKAIMEEAYNNKKWKEYMVQAHSLKSTSRTIGADELSKLAMIQEGAAQNDDEETIINGYASLIEEYEKVINILSEIIDIDDSSIEEAASDDDEILEFFPE